MGRGFPVSSLLAWIVAGVCVSATYKLEDAIDWGAMPDFSETFSLSQSVRYSLGFVDASDTTINTNMAKTYEMKLANGTVYRCGVVGPGASETPRHVDEGRSVTELNASSLEKTQARARAALDGMGGWCALRIEGFWTYEVCYDRESDVERINPSETDSEGAKKKLHMVRQFHLVPPGTDPEAVKKLGKLDFTLGQDCTLARPGEPPGKPGMGKGGSTALLGYFDGTSERSEKRRSSGMSGLKGHTKYVWDVCGKGDTCEFEPGWAGYGSDVHGAPREVEVRYGCGPSEQPLLVDVKEPSSCRYVFEVRFKALCEVDGLSGDVLPLRQIECFQVAD